MRQLLSIGPLTLVAAVLLTGGAASSSGASAFADAARAAQPSSERFRPGRLVGGLEGLEDPVAVAIDPAGRLLVLERVAARIVVHEPPVIADPLPAAPTVAELMDPARRADPPPPPPAPARVAELGAAALERPEAMVLGPDGTILVADSARRAVVVLGPDGAERALLADGRLRQPRGIAVHSGGGAVLVADAGRRAVLRVPLDGGDVTVWFDRAPDGTRLRRPTAVTALPDGRVAVADAGRARIHVLDADGTHVAAFGDFGPFPGLFEEPSAILPDAGDLLILDRGNHRLQRHGAGGQLQALWGLHARVPHEAGGLIHDPAAGAIDPDGRYLALVEPFEDRVQLFARDPAPDASAAERTPRLPRDPHFGTQVATDGDLIVLAEPEAHRIHLFDARGPVPIRVGDFGERGEGFGLLLRPRSVAIDAERGVIHVGDLARRRLQRFRVDWNPDDPPGFVPGRFRFARSVDLGVALAADGSDPIEPVDLVALPDGGVLVVDGDGDRLVRFDERLRVQDVIGGRGTEAGRFRRPVSAALAPDGRRVMVADADNARLQAIDLTDGSALEVWDAGDGRGWRDLAGVAVAADGTIWVSDRGRHELVALEPDGRVRTVTGGRGAAGERLWKPGDLSVREDGRVLVVDFGNHRASLFDADGRWWATFGTGRAFTRDDPVRRRGGGR